MEYKPSCPNCNSINTYNRVKLKPEWKCNKCNYEFNIGILYKYNRHSQVLNLIVLIALIIVSVALVGVTWYSASVSDTLADIEVYLANQNEKQETLEQITIAESLMFESFHNHAEAIVLKQAIEDNRNNEIENRVFRDILQTTRIHQASNMYIFGTQEIRIQLIHYLDIITLIKGDLERISNANSVGDDKIKIESMEQAIEDLNTFINGTHASFNLYNFQENLSNYLDERTEHYDSIDEETEKNIMSLPD